MTELPAVVLLHGLGANRHVWDGVAELLSTRGITVLAPDFRGHGRAPWTGHYSFGAMATDAATTLRNEYRAQPYAVVGHSMGGAVALALASGWFGPVPASVATIGVKIRWSDDELGRIDDLASRPPREFPDREGAVEWFMKLAGLYGVFDADDDRIEMAIEAGVMRTDTGPRFTDDGEPMRIDLPGPAPGWRASQDPATVGVGPPDLPALLPAAKCPVVMALGEHDPLVAADHHHDLAAAAAANPLTAGVTAPHVFGGLGHNAMVEDPSAVVDWLASLPGLSGSG
jgi:pimeloyl-ACP methyl ester carboxylesterase